MIKETYYYYIIQVDNMAFEMERVSFFLKMKIRVAREREREREREKIPATLQNL
jgi:hypothetical protein